MKLQTSFWFTPSPQPNQGLPLIPGFRPQSPPHCPQLHGKVVSTVGGPALPGAGRKAAPTTEHLVVTYPKESTPPHRTQEGQKTFRYRDSAQNLKP